MKKIVASNFFSVFCAFYRPEWDKIQIAVTKTLTPSKLFQLDVNIDGA